MDTLKFKKEKIFKRGRGGSDTQHKADEKLFHELLQRHDEIKRTTQEIPSGIESITNVTSKDKKLIKILQDHVVGMKQRFDKNRAIRSWDPLFVKLYDNRDKINMNYEMLNDGIKVTLTSDNDEILKLIKLHDETLHAFINHGSKAARHESPYRDYNFENQ
jgi:hypothetical protein